MSVKVTVLDANKALSAHQVEQGGVLVLQAQNNVNYQLTDQATGFGPQNIITKRQGDDLVIMLDDGNLEPDIVIENYYDQEGAQIIGLHENGNLYAYVPQSGEVSQSISLLAEEVMASQALGGTELAVPFWAFNPWWLSGAGAVLALAGVVAAAGGGSKNSGGQDNTPPSAPKVESVQHTGTNSSVVKGTAEPNTTVYIRDAQGIVIGEGKTDANGDFEITTTRAVTTDDKLVVTAKDGAGRESSEFELNSNTATNESNVVPSVSNTKNNIANGEIVSTTLTVKASPNTLVEVRDTQGNVIGRGYTDASGNVEITTTTPLMAQPYNVVALSPLGKESQPVEVTGDTTAPSRPTATLVNNFEELTDEDGNTVKTIVSANVVGKADPKATVKLLDANGNPVKDENNNDITTMADEDGTYSFKNLPALPHGQNYTVIAEDASGLPSPNAKAVSDRLEPKSPIVTDVVNGVNEADQPITTISGVGEKEGDLIDILGNDGNLITTVKVNRDLSFSAVVPPMKTGDNFRVIEKDSAQNVSKPALAKGNTDPVEAPSLNLIENEHGGLTAEGYAAPGATVNVVFPNGETRTVKADETGFYSIVDFVPQKAGDTAKVSASQVNVFGNSSPSTEKTYTKDQRAPEVELNETTYGKNEDAQPTQTISGKTEVGATVLLKGSDGSEVPATVNEKGEFEATLPAKDKDGNPITYVVEASDINSSKAEEKVVADNETDAPQFTVSQAEDGKLVVSQKAGTAVEPKAMVEVTFPDGTTQTVQANEEGKFEPVQSEKAQKVGENQTVSAKATDDKGNSSSMPEKVTVEVAEPKVVAQKAVLDDSNAPESNELTIEAQPEIPFIVTDAQGNEIGRGQTGKDGKQVITTTRPLQEGEVIKVIALDPQDPTNEEKQKTTTLKTDTNAPSEPSIEFVQNDDGTVTARVGKNPQANEPGSTIEVTFPDSTKGSAVVKADGTFDPITSAQPQPNGDAKATQIDEANNSSEPVTENYQDKKEPVAPSVNSEATLPNGNSEIRGTAEPNSTVTLKDKDGKVLGQAKADDKGNFVIESNEPLMDGADYQVTATDANGNESPKADVTADTKVNEPSVEITENSDGTLTVSPKLGADSTPLKDENGQPLNEPGSTIDVTFPDGTIGKAVVNPDGSFAPIVSEKPQTSGELSVTATDNKGNTSNVTEEYADKKEPTAPQISENKNNQNEFGEPESTTVTGTAEPNSVVSIIDPATGEVLGEGKADKDGNFIITTNKALEDKPYDVKATDEAGNSSAPTEVTGDTEVPKKPSISFKQDENGIITATAGDNPQANEPGSIIEVTFPDGSKGSAVVKADGTFDPIMSEQPQIRGGEASAVAKDEQGNSSDPDVAIFEDKIKPALPHVDSVKNNHHDNTTTLSGNAEPGALVELKDEKGNLIGAVQADDKGDFTLVVPTLEHGAPFTLTAKDENNNTSDAIPVVGDTVAPKSPAPTVESIVAGQDENGKPITVLKGKVEGAEKGTKVTVTDPNTNEVLGTAETDENGEFTLETIKPLDNSLNYPLTAIDSYNNASQPTPVKIVEPAPVLADPDNVAVKDPAALTDDEKRAVKAAVIAANPSLTDDQITVENDGTVKVNVPGKAEATLPKEQTVTAPAPTLVDPANVPVANPAALTDDEKAKVKAAVIAANPDLTDAQVTVENDGTVKVNVPGKAEATLPKEQTVTAPAPTLVDPANVPVANPVALTDDEKAKVKAAVIAANPDLTDAQVTVENDGTVKVNVPGKAEATLPKEQTVTAPAPTLVDPANVPVANPAALTDDEKAKVKAAVIAANPDLTDAQVTVENDGTVKVNVPGKAEATLPKEQTVTAPAPTLVDPANVPVANPAALTDDEKAKVKAAVIAANPDLTDAQVTVENDGTVKVNVPGKAEATLPKEQTVTAPAPTLVDPANVPVANPAALTDDEKAKVKAAVIAANPDLTDAQVTVENDGTVKVNVPGKAEATLPKEQTVTAPAPTLVDPANVPVANPAALTDDEKAKVKAAVIAANPDLTDAQVTVENDGTVKVNVPGKAEATLPKEQTVTAPAPTLVDPANVPVANPAALTDDEKAKVKAAVIAANPDLTDAQVTVENDGTVKVNVPGKAEATLPKEQTVTAPAPTLVDPANVPVANPAALTDDEKAKVKAAVIAANPSLTDDQITVENDGTVKVNVPGKAEATLPKEQTVTAPAPTLVDPANVPVANPAALTDDEKAKVKAAVIAANPDLTDAQVTVENDGTVKVNVPGKAEATLPKEQTVTAPAPTLVDPANVPVANPAALTDDEKAKVKAAVIAANPDLTDAQVTVENDGTVKVNVPGKAEATLPKEQTVTAPAPTLVDPANVPVANPAALTDDEKAKVKAAVIAANPDLTDAQVTVENDGTVKVNVPGKAEATLPKEQTVTAPAPTLVDPANVPVANPAALTDDEKAKVKAAVIAANPDLTDAQVTVENDGTVKVNVPGKAEATLPKEQTVTAPAPTLVDPANVPVANPAALTDDEKAKVKAAVIAANPSLTDDQITVENDGTVKVNVPGKAEATLPKEQTVTAPAPTLVDPANVPVANPAALTDDEKAKVKAAVIAANPDLTDAQVTVENDGTVKVNVPGKAEATLPKEQTVTAPAPTLVDPANVPVANPAALTDDEKAKVKAAVIAANPDLTDAQVTVENDGTVKVNVPGKAEATLPKEQTVTAPAPTLVDPANVPVANPAALTDDEKAKVKAAVIAANPDLTDAQVTVENDGTVKVNVPGKAEATLPKEQTVTAPAPTLVDPANVPVANPAALTDDEKAKVKAAVIAANPDLTDAQVTVENDGTVKVNVPGKAEATLPKEQTVTAPAPTLVDPANVPVANPAALTDDEKAKVKAAVIAANPSLTDDQITVENDGTVKVNVPGKAEASLTPTQTVTAPAPVLADPANVSVGNPSALTPEEKAAVKAEVKKVNPDLTDDQITVENDGTVKVNVPGKAEASLTPTQTVTAPAPVLADPANVSVGNPSALTPEEKAAVKAEVKKVNPSLTDDQITVENDGTVKVNVPGKAEASLTPTQTVTAPAPVLADPANVSVGNPSALTPEEKAAVKAEVKKVNPDLTDDQITVENDGTVKVNVPGKAEATLPKEQTVTAPAPTLVDPANVPVANPAALTDDEKRAVKAAVIAANPDLTDAQVTVENDGTVKVNVPGKAEATLPKEQTVTAPAPTLVDPANVPVANPAALTDDEKAKVKAAVIAANPDLTDAQVTVENDGTVKVNVPGKAEATLPKEQTVTAPAPTLVDPANVPVANPAALTDDEKRAVKAAVIAANPDLTDAQVTVENDGTVKVNVPGKAEATLPKEQTVTAPAPTLVDPANVPVANPAALTDDEKAKVKAAVIAANPDLTDAQVTVENDGTVKVNVPGKAEATLPKEQTVTAPAPTLVDPANVPVANPAALTDDEKAKVKAAVIAANPDLTDAQVTVENDGTVKVNVPGKAEATLPKEQTVTAPAPTLVDPANVPVANPAALTDDEKAKVKAAVIAANPDLTDAQVTVENDGTVKVNVPGKAEATLPKEQTVTAPAPTLVDPANVPVANPAALTDDEKAKVKAAVIAANPDLTDAQVTVENDGTVKVNVPGKAEATLPKEQTVTAPAPTLVDPANVPVANPAALTDDEKAKVKAAVIAANPDLTDAQVTVENDGTVKVNVPGKAEATLPKEQTVTAPAPTLVDPANVPVANPAALTDDEKAKVKAAVIAANPDLTDAQVTVENDGTVKVNVPGKAEATLPKEQTVTAPAPTLVDPANVPVANPAALTDDEKAKVKAAVIAANPDLTDAQVTVENDGTVKVNVPGKAEATLPKEQTVTAPAPTLVDPANVPVANPAALTDDEKAKVKAAVIAANPDLTDAQVTVENDGTVKVNVPGKAEATLPKEQTVTAPAPTLVDPANVPVANPAALTDDEKAKVKAAVIAANPDLTDAQVTVENDGTVKVNVPGKAEATLPKEQTVTAPAPTLVDPANVPVANPAALTDDEKAKVKAAVIAANPDLTDAQVTVENDGTVKVNVPGKAEATLPKEQTVTAPAPTLVDPANVPVANPAALTDDEKAKVKAAVIAANPDLTDAQVTVENDGTVKVNVPGKAEATLPKEQTVTAPAPTLVDPANVPVANPAALTDDEKAKVKAAVIAANPSLTDDQITVENDGTVKVNVPGKAEATLPKEQTVTAPAPTPEDPPAPETVIPPVVNVAPQGKPQGTVTITAGSDNKKLVINFTNEDNIVHGAPETLDAASREANKRELVLVKQGNTWVQENGQALPKGISVNGDVITFEPDATLENTAISVTASGDKLPATDSKTTATEDSTDDRGWSVYGVETENFVYSTGDDKSQVNRTWTATDNGDLMLRGGGSNEHLIIEYIDNGGVRRSVEFIRGVEVANIYGSDIGSGYVTPGNTQAITRLNDTWYQITDAEGNRLVRPSVLTDQFGNNILRHVNDTTMNTRGGSHLNRLVLDGTKVKDGSAVLAWEKSKGIGNEAADVFLDSSSTATGDQGVGSSLVENLKPSRKDLEWNSEGKFFTVKQDALNAPNSSVSSWGIAPTKPKTSFKLGDDPYNTTTLGTLTASVDNNSDIPVGAKWDVTYTRKDTDAAVTLKLTKGADGWVLDGQAENGVTVNADGTIVFAKGSLEDTTELSSVVKSGSLSGEALARAPITGVTISEPNLRSETLYDTNTPNAKNNYNDIIVVDTTISDQRDTPINTGLGDDIIVVGNKDQTTTGGITNSVVDMGAGNDTLVLFDRLTNTTVNMGEGNNRISMSTMVSNSSISAGSGDDVLEFTAQSRNPGNNRHVVGSQGTATIDLGDGSNKVDSSKSLTGVNIRAAITTGSGNDTFELSNSILQPAASSGNNRAETSGYINSGEGNDVVNLGGTGSLTSATPPRGIERIDGANNVGHGVNLGGGDDTLNFTPEYSDGGILNAFIGAYESGEFKGGAGYDRLVFDFNTEQLNTARFGKATSGRGYHTDNEFKFNLYLASGFEEIDMSHEGKHTLHNVLEVNAATRVQYNTPPATVALAQNQGAIGNTGKTGLLVKGNGEDTVDLGSQGATLKQTDTLTYENATYDHYQFQNSHIYIQQGIQVI